VEIVKMATKADMLHRLDMNLAYHPSILLSDEAIFL
jgi:hypothetical protein